MQAQHFNLQSSAQTRTVFREAEKKDISSIVEIENMCFSQYQLKRRNFMYLLLHGHCDFIVIEMENRTVGYAIALYKDKSDEARLYSIGIHPGFRRKNLGDTLLGELRKKVIRRGRTKLRLEVDASNFVAVRFYEKMGFEKHGMVRDYYGPNQPALRYKIRL